MDADPRRADGKSVSGEPRGQGGHTSKLEVLGAAKIATTN